MTRTLSLHPRVGLALATALATVALTTAGLALTRALGEHLVVWPAHAVLYAALLRSGRRAWPGVVLAYAVGATAAAGLHGDSAGWTAAIALAPLPGAVLTALLVRRWVGLPMRLHGLDRIALALGAAALLGPALGAFLAGGVDTVLHGHAYGRGWWEWYRAGSIGLLLFGPMLLSAQPAHLRPTRGLVERLTAIAVIAGATAWVFGQPGQTVGISALLLTVPLLWGALRHGAPLASAMAGVLVLLGAWLTGQQSGPFYYAGPALGALVLDLQLFVLVLGGGAIVLGLAIQEREGALHALRDSQARLNEAQRLAHLGSWEWNPRTAALHWSDEAFRVLGHEPGAVEPTLERFMGSIHPEDRPTMQAGIASVQAGGEPVRITYRIVRPDGAVRWVQAQGALEKGADGAPLRIFGAIQDITERKRAEDALQESEARIQSLLATLPHGVEELRVDGTIVFCNAAFARMNGYDTPQELLGLSVAALMADAEEGQRLVGYLAHLAAEQPPPASYVSRNRTRDGRVIDVQVDWDYLRDTAGRVTGFTAVITDITERKRAEDALRRAQELARLGQWYWNPATGEAGWSDIQRDILGLAPDAEATFEAWRATVHPDDWRRVEQALRRAVEHHEPYTIDFRAVRPDGTVRHVTTIAEAVDSPNGGGPLITGTLQDLTERRVLEAQVHEREQRLARAHRLVRLGHFTWHVATGEVDWSPELRALYGLPPDAEATFETFRHAVHPEDWPRLMEHIEESMADAGALHANEYRVLAPDGAVRWERSLGEWERDPDGTPLALFGTVLDITADKRAEEQLRALTQDLEARVAERTRELETARERLQYLLRNTPAVIYSAEPGEGYATRFVSENVAWVTGYAAGDFLQDADLWTERLHPDDTVRIGAAIERLLAEGRVAVEYRFRVADGGYRWMRDEMWLVRDDTGTPEEIVGALLDVTDRVVAEQELAVARETMAKQQKLATIGQLTATVSHELRNPLGTIRASAAGLLQTTADKDSRTSRVLQRIERNVARCDNIITDLLDFSRSRPALREPTAIVAWLTELVGEHAQPPWLEIQLELEAVAGLEVPLARDRIRRVVINLLDNAIQAMEPAAGDGGGRLSLSARTEQGRLLLCVTDIGPGMDEAMRARVFEPLFSTKVYGVGLGLPTVKQIVEDEGGGVDIRSEPGVGTSVEFWLPLSEPPEMEH